MSHLNSLRKWGFESVVSWSGLSSSFQAFTGLTGVFPRPSGSLTGLLSSLGAMTGSHDRLETSLDSVQQTTHSWRCELISLTSDARLPPGCGFGRPGRAAPPRAPGTRAGAGRCSVSVSCERRRDRREGVGKRFAGDDVHCLLGIPLY